MLDARLPMLPSRRLHVKREFNREAPLGQVDSQARLTKLALVSSGLERQSVGNFYSSPPRGLKVQDC